MKSPFTATVLVLIGYVGYLQLSGRIDAAMRFSDPEAKARFEAIHWDFDGWRSQPVEVPADLKQLMGADVVVRRVYESRRDKLDVWISHYTDIAEGSTHSPQVCRKLGGWQLISSDTTAGMDGNEIPMSIERYARKGKYEVVASTFLVGRRVYPTQEQAKLARARHPAPLVFTMVTPFPDSTSTDKATLQDMVCNIVRRVQAAGEPAPSE